MGRSDTSRAATIEPVAVSSLSIRGIAADTVTSSVMLAIFMLKLIVSVSPTVSRTPS